VIPEEIIGRFGRLWRRGTLPVQDKFGSPHEVSVKLP